MTIEPGPDVIAQLDQAAAGSRNLAALFGAYFRYLIDQGFSRDEALCMVIEYQHIVLVEKA
jgi:hypothetical protein